MCFNLSFQPEEAAEGFVGSTAESCGSHLLHQLPGSGRREAAEDHSGKQDSVSVFTSLKLWMTQVF